MATIERLLLSANGGIIVNSQKAPQANCAVVAIGLGGTGCDCLQNFKRAVYNQIQPDDPKAFIPEYKHFQFIAIDTDGTYRQNSETGDLTNSEFVDIKQRDLGAVVSESNVSARTDIRDWFLNPRDPVVDENGNVDNRKINIANIRDGAGGVRQVGRLSFMMGSQSIYTKISEAITRAKADLQNPDIYIFIFAGISGGTGSGCFLDTCYLTRKVIEDMAVKARISGFFFLPDVVVSRSGMSEEVKRYNIRNGIAAMKELDYCMQFEQNGDKWHQSYCGGSKTIDTTVPPVDLCHLISSTDLDGNTVSNPYRYAMGVVSSYLMDFVTSIEEVGENAMTFNSHIANFTAAIGAIHKKIGAWYGYCILGASTAIVPQKEIMTYLASHLFKAFEAKLTGDAALIGGQAADNLARSINLTHDYLMGKLSMGAITQPKITITPGDMRSQGSGWLGNWLNEQHDIACGVFEKNASNLRRALPDNYILESGAGQDSSLIAILFSKLTDLARDPERGPLYADALISSSSNRNLLSVIDGLIEENDQRLQSALFQKHFKTEYDQAKAQFDSRPSRGNAKTLIEKAQVYEANWILIEQITKLGEVLRKLKRQLDDLQQAYFGPLAAVFKDLVDTFRENRHYLESHKDDRGGSFEYYLMTIHDLEGSLNDTVSSINAHLDDNVRAFIDCFIKKPSFWMGKNENEIAMAVSTFFGDEATGVFKAYTSMTISNYLATKYQGQYPAGNDNALANLLVSNELGTVSEKAQPIFWVSAAGASTPLPNFSYFNTPAVCNAVNIAAKQLATTSYDKLRTLRASDKISVIRCRAGTPAFYYQGLDIYEGEYSSSTDPGKQYHEGKVTRYGKEAKTDRDWRKLPLPKPLSTLNDNDHSASAEALREAGALFEEALQVGVITVVETPESDEYYINFIPQDVYDQYLQRAEEAVATTDRGTFDALYAQLEPSAVYCEKQLMFYDGHADAENKSEFCKKVTKDHFCDYPEKQKLVRSEMAKKKVLAEKFAAVESRKGNWDTLPAQIETFVNILCTGAMTVMGPKIVLRYENAYGAPEEVDLSRPNMPYGSINVYQAFVTLFADPDMLAAARDAADTIINRLDASDITAMQTACAAADALLAKPRLELFNRTAKERFPDKANDIMDIISRILRAVQDFKMNMGI